MEIQEAPLNLSRKPANAFTDQSTVKQEASNMEQWTKFQNQSALSLPTSTPWCFPTVTVGYPQLAMHPTAQSLEYQRAYLQIVGTLIRKSLRDSEVHGNRCIPMITPTTQHNHDAPVLPALVTPREETRIDEEAKSSTMEPSNATFIPATSTKQRPKKPTLPGKGSFKCTQCGVSYPHRFELNRHIKVSHIRPHRCEHCGKGFGHKNYLQVHIETVHLGRKIHKCDLCGKYLSTGGNLSVHIRTIHMGEKKYKCSICSRTFGQQCNMKTHMKRHFCKPEDTRVGRINSC